jgi:hypothetical protein
MESWLASFARSSINLSRKVADYVTRARKTTTKNSNHKLHMGLNMHSEILFFIGYYDSCCGTHVRKRCCCK